MLADTRDSRFMQVVAQRATSYAAYRQRVDACLYVPAAYLHCGIKGANGSLAHYGAAADVRDALALELL